MAKIYLLTQSDLDKLTLMVDRNPNHGASGGSSDVLSKIEQDAHNKAHRFYNYQVRTWIAEVSKD